MSKNIKKYAFLTALIFIAAMFVLSGAVFASDTDLEIFADDVLEDQATYDSSPDITREQDEAGQPDVPGWWIMFGQWEKEGYPDGIGGVYFDSTTDSYGVLVVDPSPQRIAELRGLLGDEVIFTPCEFSHNELMMVRDEIVELMGMSTNSGIYGVGIGWTSTGGKVHGFGASGKEFRVAVSVDESVFDHYSAGFMSRYGERVYIEIGSAAILDSMDDGIMEGGGNTATAGAGIVPIEITGVFSGSIGVGGGGSNFFGDNYWLWLVIGIALLGTPLLFVRLRQRRITALQTANGVVVTGTSVYTRQQVAAAVKNSEAVPGDELINTIMQKINSRG